jgi:predicted molibdopterin-dependent oxidoreductase YjgC
VGCNVRVDVRVDKVLRQYSRTNDRIDDGWLCDRGRWDLDRINSLERLRTPFIRSDSDGTGGALRPATWQEALTFIAARLREIKDRYGSEAIGGIGGTHTTNEEAYLFQKLLRAGLASNNVDHRHGRFPVSGPESPLPPVWSDSIAGLEEASHIVLLGADPYHRQPLVDLRIRKAVRNGARVYVAASGPTRLDPLATGVIRYSAGHTSDIARALLRLVTVEGLVRGRYGAGGAVADASATGAAGISPVPTSWEQLAESANVDPVQLRSLAEEISGARGAVLLYDEMSTLEPGAETLASDLLRLALITDNFGRPGAGVGPLFKDNNSLGARDMGLLPDTLPGYRLVTDRPAREALGNAWHVTLPDRPGLSYDQMLGGEGGGLKALYVMGADPATGATHTQLARLDELDLLIVQDMFLTPTAARATVVLPAVSQLEKDGTLTNTERCVQVVRQAMQPLPGAKADWEILRGVARALGLNWSYLGAADILKEIGRVTPIYSGVSRRALGEGGARWPLMPEPLAEQSTGRPKLRESAYLTWQMLEQGVSSFGGAAIAGVAGDAPNLAREAGQGESE